MSETTPEPTEPAVNTDVVRSRLARHSNKLKLAALTALAGGSFYLGRKSRNVDVDVNYVPEDSATQD